MMIYNRAKKCTSILLLIAVVLFTAHGVAAQETTQKSNKTYVSLGIVSSGNATLGAFGTGLSVGGFITEETPEYIMIDINGAVSVATAFNGNISIIGMGVGMGLTPIFLLPANSGNYDGVHQIGLHIGIGASYAVTAPIYSVSIGFQYGAGLGYYGNDVFIRTGYVGSVDLNTASHVPGFTIEFGIMI